MSALARPNSTGPRTVARALGQILHAPPRHPAWAPRPIARDTLEQLHALMSVGPSLIDASPTRVLFLNSAQARTRLAQHLGPAARDRIAAAPACAIIGYDVEFAAQLVEFLPHVADAPSCFDRPEVVRQTAVHNGTLQGAYLIVAARTLGLEAAAIPEFDAAGVAFEFFRAPRVKATFLCALGYPADAKSPPRAG